MTSPMMDVIVSVDSLECALWNTDDSAFQLFPSGPFVVAADPQRNNEDVVLADGQIETICDGLDESKSHNLRHNE